MGLLFAVFLFFLESSLKVILFFKETFTLQGQLPLKAIVSHYFINGMCLSPEMEIFRATPQSKGSDDFRFCWVSEESSGKSNIIKEGIPDP